LTAYGTTGPWAERPGSGTLAEAISGLAALTGPADAPPTLSPVGLGDFMGVLQGIVAALVSLYARDAAGSPSARRGRGEVLDVAMYEPLLALLSTRLATAARDGVDPGRHGNRFPNVAPRNTYRTGDGRWVALTAGTEDLARRVLEVVGRPDLADDERFRTNLARVAHADELDAVIGGWIGERSCDAVVEAFTRARVSLAAVDAPTEVVRNPHFRARGSLVEVEDDDAGRLTLAAPSPARAADGGRVRWLGRALGADNDAVYRDWLGIAPGDLERLRAEGVI
jgi:crotonobetainyl-CoA:carnitine CoA-transferase CaiB-like acyl-CoA transferase